ncbi:protein DETOXIFICATION 30-like isoform X2 [Panicum virgatum]|nr:protein DETOXIFICATION 30-like isoform X2 [Panicum virgatum]KAG2621074.1 hypothetical protein PVAP13_3NG224000 [Panicum virgatum]
MKKLVSKSWEESRLLWQVAFPAILTEVFQFSIGFVTTGFVGHLGEVELAAVTVVENIIELFAFGVLFGIGSALDTLCGQAVGAGQLDMLGIYTQQSWLVCGATAVALTPAYAFTSPILRSLLRQPADVSAAAGPYARWAIPRLFAHAANYPLLKFFQTQSRVWAVAAISGASLAAHVALTYAAVRRLGFGLRGAAVAGNISHWLIVVAQLVYMVRGRFPDSWKGFSIRAFRNLGAFVKLSLASAVMICLEVWYYMALLILVGLLKNAKLQLDIMSVCINYEFWTMMMALGFSTAISVRVSNELGANRPKVAQFSVVVAAATSAFVGATFMAVFLVWRTSLPKFFSDSEEVIHGASRLGYLLAVSVLLSNIWPLLSGVAVGSGLQVLVAFINVGTYYLVGIPLGVLFGFKLKLGTMGIWMGMLTGTSLQIAILLFIIVRMKWETQSKLAVERTAEWEAKNNDRELMASI